MRVPDIRVEHLAGPHHLYVRHAREVARLLLGFLEPQVRLAQVVGM